MEKIGYGGDGLERIVREYFEGAIPAGDFLAWIAEEDGRIIAMSGLVFLQKLPHGRNPSGKEGFVLNMYTLPDWRGRGICTALVERMVEYVRQAGVTCIRLHASEDGVGIYSKLGFQPDDSEMLLDLGE